MGLKGFFLGWWNVLKLDNWDSCTIMWIYSKLLIWTPLKAECYGTWIISQRNNLEEGWGEVVNHTNSVAPSETQDSWKLWP